MSYYRLLFKKSIDGPVIDAREIAARDDVDAVRIARKHVGGETLELWCNKRKVTRFAAIDRRESALAY